MESMCICAKASSPWASPLHMVTKQDGSWMSCGDYRRLNLIPVPDQYPMPNITDLTNNIGNQGRKSMFKHGGDNSEVKYTSRLRDVLRDAKRRALLWGFGYMPPENFFKWCNLVRFVYFVYFCIFLIYCATQICIFCIFLYISYLLRDAKRRALLWGFGGMPPENFFKWCNLVRFGVYLDQILSLKHLKSHHFLYNFFKNYHFLYKNFIKLPFFNNFFWKYHIFI